MLNQIKFAFPAILISFIYFFFPTMVSVPILFFFVVILWATAFLTIKNQDVIGRLLILMIFSIPVSFVSITGTISQLVFFNWFNVFSIILFLYMSIGIVKNYKTMKFDFILSLMVISQLALIVSFFVNIDTMNSDSITQFMMISFYIMFTMILYLYLKIPNRFKKTNLELYLKLFILMTSVVSISVIIQMILYRLGFVVGRIEIFGGNRTGFGYINFDYSFLSLLIISNMFYILSKIFESKKRLLYSFLAFIHLFASIITSARTGMISFVVVLVLFSFIYLLIMNKLSLSLKSRMMIFLVALTLSMFGMYFISITRGFGGSGRSEVYIESLNAFLKRPLFGYGLSWVSDLGTIPHNFFIQYMTQIGLVFLVPLFVWLVLLINKVRKSHFIIFLNLLVIFMGSMFIPDILNSRFLILMISFGIISFKLDGSSDYLNVAHLLSSGGYSGAEVVAINVIKSSPERTKSVYVSPKGVIEGVLEQEGIPHLTLKPGVFKENAIDVVYAHDFKATFKAALSLSGVPVISHIHQNPNWFSKINLKSLLFLICSYYTDTIVFVSQETLDEFIFYKKIKNKSYVLTNFVDSNNVVEKSLQSVDEVELFDMGYLGRLDPVKNPLEFLKIVNNVKNELPNIKAVMIGDGTLREEVESYQLNHDLVDNVTIKGYLPNPYPILKNCSMLVIPSIWEGFGLNAVEAMILGVPVLAAPVGGLKTVVDSRAGFLCQTTQEFSDYAYKLLTNDTLLENLSSGSIESAARFTDRLVWENGVHHVFKNFE